MTKQLDEFQWEQDEAVTICKICNKDFNVARRKHHCRRCGGIFCNECSDNKMPLPSSSKVIIFKYKFFDSNKAIVFRNFRLKSYTYVKININFN